jgi:hypothetical protein
MDIARLGVELVEELEWGLKDDDASCGGSNKLLGSQPRDAGVKRDLVSFVRLYDELRVLGMCAQRGVLVLDIRI